MPENPSETIKWRNFSKIRFVANDNSFHIDVSKIWCANCPVLAAQNQPLSGARGASPEIASDKNDKREPPPAAEKPI